MNLTEAHRRIQLRLGAETAALIAATWRLLDPSDDRSVARWLAIVTPVIGRQRAQSARLAATYYQAERATHLDEPFTPALVSDFADEQVKTSLLVTGPVAYRASLGRGVAPATALDTAVGTSAAAGLRLALNAGRDTILENTRTDQRSIGWRRVTSGKACKWCAARAGMIVHKQSVDFHSHDGCACAAAPLFSAA